MPCLVNWIIRAVAIVLARILKAARLQLTMCARVFALAHTRGQTVIARVQSTHALVFARIGIACVLERWLAQKAKRRMKKRSGNESEE